MDDQQEFSVWLRELKSQLCNNPEGWDGVGGGSKGTYVYLRLIHVDVWQRPTEYCKAIILRLKTKLSVSFKASLRSKNIWKSIHTCKKKSSVDLLSILSDMIKVEYVSDGVYVKEKW